MEQNSAIKCLAAIAHDGRLTLMRRLIKAGPKGLSSGALAKAENLNPTTASAQLLVLSNTGLVKSERAGKQIFYRANFAGFQELISFLMEDCCQGACDE